MNMNPMSLLQIKGKIQQFRKDHQKVSAFLTVMKNESLEAGTVLELKVKDLAGRERVTNMRLNENDVEMIKMILDIGGA